MTGEADAIPADVLQEATAWLYRIEAAPDDETLRDALYAWIGQGETHERAWRLTMKAWDLTGKVRPAVAEAGAGAGRNSAAVTMRRRAGAAVASLAACLALLILAPDIRTRIEADHATGTGETREVALADGSVVHMGADSAIAADFSAGTRALALLRGGAFFRVAADRARPFVVTAKDLTVTVTGTAFDVAIAERAIAVAVASGMVRVAPGTQGAIDLARGERLVLDRKTGAVARSAVPEPEVATWRGGRLVVEDTAFADVVDAIARYHRGAIVIADPSLGERRVTGVYDLRDPARALGALAGPYGGVVRTISPYLIVVTGF